MFSCSPVLPSFGSFWTISTADWKRSSSDISTNSKNLFNYTHAITSVKTRANGREINAADNLEGAPRARALTPPPTLLFVVESKMCAHSKRRARIEAMTLTHPRARARWPQTAQKTSSPLETIVVVAATTRAFSSATCMARRALWDQT